MTGAQKLRIDGRQELPLGDHCVTVLRAEGTVQLLFTGTGCGPQPPLLMNMFVGAGTAAELRALADALDRVPELREVCHG